MLLLSLSQKSLACGLTISQLVMPGSVFDSFYPWIFPAVLACSRRPSAQAFWWPLCGPSPLQRKCRTFMYGHMFCVWQGTIAFSLCKSSSHSQIFPANEVYTIWKMFFFSFLFCSSLAPVLESRAIPAIIHANTSSIHLNLYSISKCNYLFLSERPSYHCTWSMPIFGLKTQSKILIQAIWIFI